MTTKHTQTHKFYQSGYWKHKKYRIEFYGDWDLGNFQSLKLNA